MAHCTLPVQSASQALTVAPPSANPARRTLYRIQVWAQSLYGVAVEAERAGDGPLAGAAAAALRDLQRVGCWVEGGLDTG